MLVDEANDKEVFAGKAIKDPKDYICHSKPTLGRLEFDSLQEVVGRGFVGYGVQSKRLESYFCKLTGNKFAFVVQSGSQALTMSLLALGLSKGAAVAIPVLSCNSVLQAVLAANYRPILCNILKDSLTLDPDTLPGYIDAFVAPHAYGMSLDVVALEKIGLPWIEDCATSPATVVSGRSAGASGTTAIFSLNSTKYITAGHGGILVTNDSAIATKVFDWLECQAGSGDNELCQIMSGRLGDINAALALVQCKRMSCFLKSRRQIAAYYDRVISNINGVTPMRRNEGDSFYRYIVHVDQPAQNYISVMKSFAIDARSSVNPWLDTLMPVDTFDLDYGIIDYWRDHLLSLPIYPGLKRNESKRIMDALTVVGNN